MSLLDAFEMGAPARCGVAPGTTRSHRNPDGDGDDSSVDRPHRLHGRTDALTTRRDPAGDCHGDIPLTGNQASGDGPFGRGTGTSGPTLHIQLAGSARVGPGPAFIPTFRLSRLGVLGWWPVCVSGVEVVSWSG